MVGGRPSQQPTPTPLQHSLTSTRGRTATNTALPSQARNNRRSTQRSEKQWSERPTNDFTYNNQHQHHYRTHTCHKPYALRHPATSTEAHKAQKEQQAMVGGRPSQQPTPEPCYNNTALPARARNKPRSTQRSLTQWSARSTTDFTYNDQDQHHYQQKQTRPSKQNNCRTSKPC